MIRRTGVTTSLVALVLCATLPPLTSNAQAVSPPHHMITQTRPTSTALTPRIMVTPVPVLDNQPAQVTARTRATASCTVRVVYASGYAATSMSLKVTKVATSQGLVRWTWTPATSVPGPSTATVTCSLAGQSATATKSFTVQ